MKTLTLAIYASIALLFSNLLYATTTPTSPLPLENKVVLGVATNRDIPLDAKAIQKGQDSFMARLATPGETLPKDSFSGLNGKVFIPIHSFATLRSLDANKDGVLSITELQADNITLVTARYLEGTQNIIPERPISQTFDTIQLPKKTGEPAIARIGEDNNLLIQEVNLQQ